jgi:hypothetical protein
MAHVWNCGNSFNTLFAVVCRIDEVIFPDVVFDRAIDTTNFSNSVFTGFPGESEMGPRDAG